MQQRNMDRNSPCPCGSGKKYKHCCATLVAIGEGYENRRIDVTLLYGVRERA